MQIFRALPALATLFSRQATGQQQYTIDPSSVANSTREYWCTQEVAECPLICLQTTNDGNTLENSCDPNQLTYSCICGNSLSPNLTQYTQTLPFFLCQQWGTECVSNCGQNSDCANDCRAQHPCGAQNPLKPNTSTLSATMTSSAAGGAGMATTTSGGVYTGFAGASGSSAAAAASAGGAYSVHAAALSAGRTFGLLGVVGALFGGFAILL